MTTESAIESAMEAEPAAEAVTPMPMRTDHVQWQSKLIELLAKLENLRLQLAGTCLTTDSDFILERSETMVQLTEELANATTFSDRSTEPQMAILALFADVMRWNTSCCGTEPSIIVTPAPRKVTHSHGSAGGKKSSLPASAACCSTGPTPPVMPLTTQPM